MADTINLSQAVKSEEFILQECKQLRDEIWTRVEDQRKTEKYLLLAFAIVYWFLALHGGGSVEASDDVVACAWYVPPVLAFLVALRWRENVRLIVQIADYTRKREEQLLGPKGGWETYLKKVNNGRGPSVLFSWHYVCFWEALIFATTAIAVYQHSWFLTTTTERVCAAILIGVFAAMASLSVIAPPIPKGRTSAALSETLD
jgi:hypothetical protein